MKDFAVWFRLPNTAIKEASRLIITTRGDYSETERFPMTWEGDDDHGDDEFSSSSTPASQIVKDWWL
jgi:hypothetical protein